MAYCKIFSCQSRLRDKNRNFFKVTPKNEEEWMPIIKSTYPEGHAFPSLKVIAVCDLHFDAKVIIQLGSKKGLAVDAIPNVRLFAPVAEHTKQVTTMTGVAGAAGLAEENNAQRENDLDWLNDGLNDCSNDQDDGHHQPDVLAILEISDANNNDNNETRTININVYKKLCQKSIEWQKSQEIIGKLKQALLKQSAVIREQQKKIRLYEKNENKNSVKVTENIPNHMNSIAFADQLHLNQQDTEEIIECLKYGKANRKYSEKIRQFCMGIDYCSPAAYRYVRRVFHNHLPAPYTIRRWYKSINGEPGITMQSLEILKQKAAEKASVGKELLIALMSDEIATKKSIDWDESGLEFSGFVSCENRRKKEDQLAIAKDALVFMAVGDDFKIPVAYFLLCGLESLERAALTQNVIRQVNETGARVISLTGDGLISNIAVLKHLGVNFDEDKTYFKSPTNPDDRIYAILDPPHMLKLFRGCLATHQLYFNNKPICWKYIVELHQMQMEKNINLGNKLTNHHINYKARPMNVQLAAQTMSRSVVDCIDQLREDNYNKYLHSEETSEFIMFVNNTFDIGNVKAGKTDQINSNYKRPICETTAEDLFAYFREAKEYFKSIQIDEASGNKKKQTRRVIRKLALRSRSFTPFLGVICNMNSFEGLYNDYVLNGPLKALYTFQFSQDHLETWFSCVRRGLGANDNPTANEFKRLYRKLLVCHEVVYDGKKANCLSNETGILTVSSEIISKSQNVENLVCQAGMIDLDGLDFNYHEAIAEELEKFEEHLNAYAARLIEEKIKNAIQTQRNKCKRCLKVFHENEKASDSFIRRKMSTNAQGQQNQPCKSTVQIIKAINKLHDLLPHKGYDVKAIIVTTLQCLDYEDLFDETDFDEHRDTDAEEMVYGSLISHKENFIIEIIKAYCNMKANNIFSKISDEERGNYIRHRNKKLTHLAGQ